MAFKQCKFCHRLLPTTEYYRHPHGKDGLRSRCRDCLSAEGAIRRTGQPSRVLSTAEYRRRYGVSNRRNARATQRAYRLLAQRHHDEFQHLLIIEKALLEEEEET